MEENKDIKRIIKSVSSKVTKKIDKKVDKRKVIKLILILLVVMLILLGIIIYYSMTDELLISKRKLEYINSEEWNSELYPDGMPAFYRSCSGKLTAQNMGKSIYYVVTELIPKYYSNLKGFDENALKEYYEKKHDIVQVELGISDENKFVELIKEIQQIDSDNIEFESYYIDEESITTKNGRTSANLYIKYENCDEIVLKITALKNTQDDSSPIIYSK